MATSFSIRAAADYLGVSTFTLRSWEREGRINAVARTLGNHRRYTKANLDAMRGQASAAPVKKTIAYARVSSHDQKQDLVRQGARLLDYCAAKGWSCELIEDLGSGLNYKKKGLRQLLDAIHAGGIERLVITHKDRLLRLGAELIFEMCRQHDIEVVVLESTEHLGFEAELARDVIELVTVFSARLYGKRSHKTKQAVEAVAQVLTP